MASSYSTASTSLVARYVSEDIREALVQTSMGLGVSGPERQLLSCLLAYADRHGIDPFKDPVPVSLSDLAHLCGVCRSTIRRWAATLEERETIYVGRPEGYGPKDTYQFGVAMIVQSLARESINRRSRVAR